MKYGFENILPSPAIISVSLSEYDTVIDDRESENIDTEPLLEIIVFFITAVPPLSPRFFSKQWTEVSLFTNVLFTI